MVTVGSIIMRQLCALILIGCALAILIEYERQPTITAVASTVSQAGETGPPVAPDGRLWLLAPRP
jgi:hypothetical protein